MNTNQTERPQANLLIVDDTLDNLELLAAVLNKRGYQTRCIDNGFEAIKVARSGWADLILLDIQMPDMDGYQVCEQLKADAQTQDIPIIFISALDDFANKKRAFKVGGVDYINKPFEIKEVVVRVANQITIKSNSSKIIELNNQLEQKIKERTAELENSNQQLQEEVNRRQQAQDRLLKMALNDPITGFGNRNSFVSRLKQALRVTGQQPNYYFAVILLECDRFKTIKRTISNVEANQLLMAIAHELDSCLPDSALLSRLEGDEFAIFLDNIRNMNEAISVVEKIRQKLTTPFAIKQRKILINANMGIVIGSQDYQDIDRLFNDADIAMQQAKDLEGDRYQVFKPEMYIQLQEDRELANHEMSLKQAIQRQEFVNYYLPIISLATQKIVELEALIRWHHPQQGVILPQDFIATAEDMGLMNAIGNLVLKQACQHIKHWQHNNKSQNNLGICINLSAKQLFHPSLVDKVDLILRKTEIQGQHIKFDIAETILLEQPQNSLSILQKLKKRRVKLCLDNFGSGYSSLTCLHRFPFDELSIDRSLIAHIGQAAPNLEQEKSTTLLLKQIIAIAHQMNMVVIATGIENNFQLNLLKNLGCDQGQGYLISKLLDKDAVDKYLLMNSNKQLTTN